MSNPVTLPHRFRESSFRKYEDIIATAVANYPRATKCEPNGSPETFSCRLRDAMRSLVDNKWPTEKINLEKFMAIREDLTVRIFNSGVIIHGSNMGAGMPVVTAVCDVISSEEDEPIIIESPTKDEVSAVALLLANRRLKGVRFTNVSHELSAFIPGLGVNFDVLVQEIDPKTFDVK